MRRISYTLLLAVVLLAWTVTMTLAKDNEQLFRLKPGAGGKLCLNCHADFKDKLARPFVHSPLKKGECASCHNPHTSSHGKLLAGELTNVCQQCHTSVIGAKPLSIHKVVANGECMKCHDPHAAPNKNNLTSTGSQLCFGCHKEMGAALAKVKFHHSPVEKGCLTCHLPHASDKGAFLLRDTEPALCLGCHAADKPLFIKKHMNYPVAQSRCTGCHDPHGSNIGGILYENVHKPVANRMCNQCHEEPTAGAPLKTKKTGIALCKGCHNDMLNQMFAKKRIHWPLLTKEGCLSCHNPHAGKKKGMLRAPVAQLCGSCHTDTMRRLQKTANRHQPVVEGRCAECHDAHASNFLYLAKAKPDFDLCVTCHDWGKHSTHPIGEKTRDQRNRNLSIGCISCHRSHGTEFKKMLLAPTTTELCTQCHEQFKR